MVYEMIARRESETVRSKRASALIAVMKARVWASEGWDVTIVDGDGKIFERSSFDELLARSLPGAAETKMEPNAGAKPKSKTKAQSKSKTEQSVAPTEAKSDSKINSESEQVTN